MKINYDLLFIISAIFLISSCRRPTNDDAIQYLNHIQQLYRNQNYIEALNKIDSIQILFPKAFDEIKAGIALKQEVRRSYDEQQIAVSDSLISKYQPKLDSIKQLFVYRKDKEDEQGEYIPRSINTNTITMTTLRSGVYDDGRMYLESTYIGGQLHDRVAAVSKDKQSVESLRIEDDGFNFRFSHSGKQYEVIRVTPFHDNGLADFLYKHNDVPLTIQLKGKNTTSFTLSNIQKKAITDSYRLSKMMMLQDSLAVAKDKATVRIKYLDSKKNQTPQQE